jgi:hypothetical protein
LLSASRAWLASSATPPELAGEVEERLLEQLAVGGGDPDAADLIDDEPASALTGAGGRRSSSGYRAVALRY